MKIENNILVFSENRETQSVYRSLAHLIEATITIREKNKNSLQAILEMLPQIIVVEIMQPVMSEIEFVDQVYEMRSESKIIIVSSYFFDTADIVFGDKIQAFLPKPLAFNKLLDSVQQMMQKSAAEKLESQITSSKETRIEDVIQETKKLSVLLEISRSLNSIVDFDELLRRIIVLVCDTVNAERATLFIVDKQRKMLWSRVGVGIEKSEISFPLNRGIAGEVATSGEAQIIDNPYLHPQFNKEIDQQTGFKTRNILCVPMRNTEGAVMGVFQILNKVAGTFTREDQLFISAMASSIGIVIENALLHQEMKKQFIEVQNAYNDLYVTQNQMMKEIKTVTFSEIVGSIKEILIRSNIQNHLQQLQEVCQRNPIEKIACESVVSDYKKIISSIEESLKAKKQELYK
jgi:CheY-like chemotaxis protein/putative methionine-R-sulfoxide reductase with GAF domain